MSIFRELQRDDFQLISELKEETFKKVIQGKITTKNIIAYDVQELYGEYPHDFHCGFIGIWDIYHDKKEAKIDCTYQILGGGGYHLKQIIVSFDKLKNTCSSIPSNAITRMIFRLKNRKRLKQIKEDND